MSAPSSSAVQSAPASHRVIAFPNLSASSTSSATPSNAPSTSAASHSPAAPSTRPRAATLRMFPYSLAAPNPWFITQEQLTALSPSTADGICPASQTLLRAETADFISQMGQQCKITQLAIATGSVYLHVFFTRFSFARFDRFEIAATCLFLAGKVEERRTRVDQVINAYYHVRLNPPATPTAPSAGSTAASANALLSSAVHLLPPSPTSAEYEALRNRIYSLEFVVLDAIEFQFELTHPYTNLMVFLRETILGHNYANKPEKLIHNETSEKGGLAQIAWLFINDSLRSTLCLLYPPDVICVGVIALSLKYKEMDEPVRHGVPVTEQTRPWHEELFGVDRQTIEHISDVILTCVELRYKPDPAQAQALLAEKVTPPVTTTLPVAPLPPATTAASHAGGVAASQSSRPVISIPLPASAAPASSASRSRPSGGAGGRGPAHGRGGDAHSRGAHRPHEPAPMSDVIERVVPASMYAQQQQSAQSRHALTAQPPASSASQPQKTATSASRPQQQKKGYVWKPPAKSRRAPSTASTTESDAQHKPAAPTRPVSPSTPPSPFLSHMSPSSRPPSPFVQSLSPMSASKRKDPSSVPFTAASRKRPHSPSAAMALLERAVLASTRLLARNDSNGQSEQLLVEQMGQKMRVVSADDGAHLEDGELLSERQRRVVAVAAGADMGSMKAAEEHKEDDEQRAGLDVEAEGSVRVILDDLHALKSSASVQNDKRDELAMMDDVDKFRAELAEGDTDAVGMEHEGTDAETAEDIRAWKRARHDERDSPVSPTPHAASMATPWEREMDGDGVDEAEPESEFDHSQPSSPAALDESEHRLDQFAAVKLQSGYNARHEQQLDGGEHADGMDDGDSTLSGYPSKACHESTDARSEHSLLTT